MSFVRMKMNEEASIEQHIRNLEEKLLQSAIRNSPEDVAALLAPEFTEFGSSGRVFDRKSVIEGLQAEPSAHRSLMDFKAQVLAQDVVLVTYRAICHGASDEILTHSLRSSVWKLMDGRWQLVFHQGTLLREA